MSRTAYIAGKIAGLPRANVKEKFEVVASQLKDQGYDVVKPAAVTEESGSWDACLKRDIKNMLDCDEVHMLPDWQESRSAQLERDIAMRLGIDVIYH